MFKKTFGVIGALILSNQPAYAKTDGSCELHIWTTNNIQATFNGATVGFINGSAAVTGLTYSPLDDVAKRLAESVDASAQRRIFEFGDIQAVERFKGYQLVFHEAPAVDKYEDIGRKDLGKGPRDSNSNSSCYAEIHVLYISLLKMPMGKKILTGFLFRDFSADGDAIGWLLKTPESGAAGFHTNGEAKSEAERESVREAVRKNLQSFLRSKRFKTRTTQP